MDQSALNILAGSIRTARMIAGAAATNAAATASRGESLNGDWIMGA